MRKEPFKYFCILIFVCYAVYWGYNHYFPTKYVYVEDDRNIYHSTPVCDNAEGIHVLEDIDDIVGCKKMDEKEVFYNKKYIMCNYCFSPMEIEYRTKYINRSLK